MIAYKAQLFTLALWLATVTANSNTTYIRGDRNLAESPIAINTGHIVGGSPATIRSWFVHFGDGICGGSLISPNRVLTAAHCVQNGAPRTVRVGATTQTDGTVARVECANTHPDYDGFVGNDIAIIKLQESVSNTPVDMNFDTTTPVTGEALTVIGTSHQQCMSKFLIVPQLLTNLFY